MSKVCDITAKRTQTGNRVSHANNKTRRKFLVNLKVKRLYVPEYDAWVTMKVSMSALRTINKQGVIAVLRKAERKGSLTKDLRILVN